MLKTDELMWNNLAPKEKFLVKDKIPKISVHIKSKNLKVFLGYEQE